jgi:hypothetical protein
MEDANNKRSTYIINQVPIYVPLGHYVGLVKPVLVSGYSMRDEASFVAKRP